EAQARRGVTEMPGHVDGVAGPGARAGEGLRLGPSPERDGDHGLLRRGEVPAYERRAELARSGDRPARDRQGKLLAALGREGDREEEELRPGAHRRQVREVDRGRAAPQSLGILAGEEVDALDEEVGRRGEGSGGAGDDRGVVAGREDHAGSGRKQRAEPFDEAILGLHGGVKSAAWLFYGRGPGGALRPVAGVAATGISRAGGSGAAGASGDSPSASGASRAIASTSSMLST